MGRDFLKRGLDAEGSAPFADATHQDMRTLVCAQYHSEYYFKDTEWVDSAAKERAAKVVTFPWDNGLSAEAIEMYYDDRGFADWIHALSKTKMLKVSKMRTDV